MTGMDYAEQFKEWLRDEIGAEVIIVKRISEAGEWYESDFSFENCWADFWESIS